MISLFLNTASNYLHVALIKDNKLEAEVFEKLDRDLSRMALVRVKELLEKNGFVPSDVDNIYVVEGPGSFTGLRVGVTIAKTFAWGLGKKLFAVSNLNVMAASVSDFDYVVPLIDARRGYVYAGIYDISYENYLSDRYIKLDDLLDVVSKLEGRVIFVSNDLFDNAKINVFKYVPNLNSAWDKLRAREVDCFTFEPSYLKKTEAEETLVK